VRLVAVIAGDLNDFDQPAFRNEISAAVFVRAAQISIDAEPASIRVTVEILVESAERQAEVLALLLAFFAAWRPGDTLFGVVVELLFEPEAFGLFPPPPSPLPTTVAIDTGSASADLTIVLATTSPVLLLILLCVVILCMCRRRSRKRVSYGPGDFERPPPVLSPRRVGRFRPSFRRQNTERRLLDTVTETVDENTLSFIASVTPRTPGAGFKKKIQPSSELPASRTSHKPRGSTYLVEERADADVPSCPSIADTLTPNDYLDSSTLLNVTTHYPSPSASDLGQNDVDGVASIRDIDVDELPNPFMGETSHQPRTSNASIIVPPGLPPGLLRARRAAAREAAANEAAEAAQVDAEMDAEEAQEPPTLEGAQTGALPPQTITQGGLAASSGASQPLLSQLSRSRGPPHRVTQDPPTPAPLTLQVPEPVALQPRRAASPGAPLPQYPEPRALPPSLLRARRHAEAEAAANADDASYLRWAEAGSAETAGLDVPVQPTFADTPSEPPAGLPAIPRMSLRLGALGSPRLGTRNSWDGGRASEGSAYPVDLPQVPNTSRADLRGSAWGAGPPPPIEAWALTQAVPPQPHARATSGLAASVCAASTSATAARGPIPPPIPPSLLRARAVRAREAEEEELGISRETF